MADTRYATVKPILMQVLGYSFLVLGVLGLFLPFLQGFLFLAVGLVILARHAAWARRLLDHLRAQHPSVDRAVGRSEARLQDWGQRFEAWMHHWSRRIGDCFKER